MRKRKDGKESAWVKTTRDNDANNYDDNDRKEKGQRVGLGFRVLIGVGDERKGWGGGGGEGRRTSQGGSWVKGGGGDRQGWWWWGRRGRLSFLPLT